MKRRHYTPEQIIRKLREVLVAAKAFLAGG
jgi:hypothetical protein